MKYENDDSSIEFDAPPIHKNEIDFLRKHDMERKPSELRRERKEQFIEKKLMNLEKETSGMV